VGESLDGLLSSLGRLAFVILQRPRYVSGKGIGKWEDMVDILVIISIISQSRCGLEAMQAVHASGARLHKAYMTRFLKAFASCRARLCGATICSRWTA
jgi:hypothetical protein